MRLRAKPLKVDERGLRVIFGFHPDHEGEVAHLQKLKELGREVAISYEEWREIRSLPQNALFHLIISKIARGTANTPDQVKEYLKETYGPREKIVVKTPVWQIVSKDTGQVFEYDSRAAYERVKGDMDMKLYDDVGEVKVESEKLIIKPSHRYTTLEMHDMVTAALALAADMGVDVKEEHDQHLKHNKQEAQKSESDRLFEEELEIHGE